MKIFSHKERTQAHSTHASRQISEVQPISYNINDFLPEPTQISETFTFFKSQSLHNQSRIIEPSKVSQNQFVCHETNEEASIKLKQIKIAYEVKLDEQSKKYSTLEEEMNRLKEQIFCLQKQKSEQIQNSKKLEEKNQILEAQLEELIKSVKQKSERIAEIERDLKRKTQRIGIFCQKYEVNIEPKIKHSYSIEVQTEKYKDPIQQVLLRPEFTLGRGALKREEIDSGMKQYSSNRKISCQAKPQFYELYQMEKNKNLTPADKQFAFDLNSHPTTRSQTISTGLKPKKPSFLENKSSVAPDFNWNKENNKKKINERLNFDANKKGHKKQSKVVELEIACVEQADIDGIVNSILNF